MVAKDLINHNIATLKTTDDVERALEILNDAKHSQLPCLVNETFLGTYTEDLLLNFDNETLLSDIPPLIDEHILAEFLPLIEVIKIFQLAFIDVLPVFSDQNLFLGLVEKKYAYNIFIEQLKLNEPGSILEISLKENNYSLTEISRIIETENAKIICLYTAKENDNLDNNFQLILKINVSQISAIVNSLTRFGYEVSSYFATEPVENLEKDRYDLLMKYLSI
jgi:acetoin utilization protein AcuB